MDDAQGLNPARGGVGREFLFVTTTSPSRPNPETMKLVRSQAMKDFVRKEKQSKDDVQIQEFGEPLANPGEVHRFKLKPNELRPTFTQPKLKKSSSTVSERANSTGKETRNKYHHQMLQISHNSIKRSSPRNQEANLPVATPPPQENNLQGMSAVLVGNLEWSPGLQALDPFDTLPVPSTPRLDFLIRHCKLAPPKSMCDSAHGCDLSLGPICKKHPTEPCSKYRSQSDCSNTTYAEFPKQYTRSLVSR